MIGPAALAPHPLAQLIPAMTDDEYSSLRDDIKANGQREPITLYEDKVLDGRHRARACAELDVEPITRVYDGDAPAAYVLSLNLARRSLTLDQRAVLAVDFLPALEAEARMRQGHGETAPGRQRSESPDTKRSEGATRSYEEAGEKTGVSSATVGRAKRVKRDAPDDFERMRQGKTTLAKAHRKVAGKPARDKTKRPTIGTNSERGQTIAEANKRKLYSVCASLLGHADGLENFPYERALALATDEDRKAWTKSLDTAIKALRRARSAIKEDS